MSDGSPRRRTTGSVTVIVIGYNHDRYIGDCLDSVRTQTASPDRVLVADDASTDDSREIVDAYLAKYPGWAEFFPNPQNRGLTPTLNRMLAMVDTEFVTYISADDLMLPTRLERHASLMTETGATLAYSDAIVIGADSHEIHPSSKIEFPWPDEPGRSEATAENLLAANWIPAASMFLRTEELRRAGGYADAIFFEDFELLVRLACQGARFAYIDEPLVAVRRLDTSLGATGFDRDNPRYLIAMDAALRHYRHAASAPARRALAIRWELAKRARRSDVPLRTRLEMLYASRDGAGSPFAFAYHLARSLGPRRSRPTGGRS